MALESYRRQRVISKSANADFGQIIMLNAGDVDGRIVRFEAAKGNGRANTACKLWIDKGEGLAVFCELIRVDMPTPTWEAAIPVRGLDVGMYDAAIRLEDVDGSITETMPLRVQVVGSILAESEATEEMQDALDDFETRTAIAITAANAATAAANSAAASAASAASDAYDAANRADQSRVTADTAEAARASAEEIRVAAEDARATAETARATAETARASAEAERQAAEALRASAETARASAETARASAETARASAEAARETASRQATEAATTAAESATSAASSANSAATSATSAASSANSAATSATSAATAANTAATSATSAAETATDAAGTATSAASSANTAATSATSAANAANSAANSATSAATAATNAATSANNAATAATTATTSANTATTNANSATTAATSAAESATDATTAANTAAEGAASAADDAESAAEEARAAAATIADKADVDGDYKLLSAGSADTLGWVDEESGDWTQRTSAKSGTAKVGKILGDTIVWNQMVINGDFSSESYWKLANTVNTYTVSDNEMTVTCAETGKSCAIFQDRSPLVQMLISGHKYLLKYDIKSSNSINIGASLDRGTITQNTMVPIASSKTSTEYKTFSAIGTYNSVGAGTAGLRISGANSDAVLGETVSYRNVVLFDLTRMFGAGNEPSTVEEFEDAFGSAYYEYDEGSLVNAEFEGIESSGVQRSIPIAEYFDGGMKAIGEMRDELTGGQAVKRVGAVDLGDLSWSTATPVQGNTIFVSSLPITDAKPVSQNNVLGSIECAALSTETAYNLANHTSEGVAITTARNIRVYASKYESMTVEQFKAAMDGVVLNYELETPVITEIDPPLGMTYPVVAGGIERVISDGVCAVPSWEISYAYGMDAVTDGISTAHDSADAAMEVAQKAYARSQNCVIGEMSMLDGATEKVDDAWASPLRWIEVEGKSTQVSTNGKNKLDESGLTSESYINYSTGDYVPTTGSKNSTSDYISVSDFAGESMTQNHGCYGATTGIAFFDSSKQYISGAYAGGGSGTLNANPVTFTVPEGAAYMRTTVATEYIGQSQIELGSTATAYVPYDGGYASPSPDHPQPIHSVAEARLVIMGNQLYSGREPLTFSFNNFYYGEYTLLESPKSGQQYTLSYYAESNVEPFDCSIGIGSSSGSGNKYLLDIGAIYDKSNGLITITFTVTQANIDSIVNRGFSADSIVITFRPIRYRTLTTASCSVSNIMLNEGPTALPWEPYAGTTTPLIPSGTEPLRSLPGVASDHMTVHEDGSREIARVVAERTISGFGTVVTTETMQYARIDFEEGSLPNWSSSSGNHAWLALCDRLISTKQTTYIQRTWNNTYIYTVNPMTFPEGYLESLIGAKVVARIPPTTETLPSITMPETPSADVTVWLESKDEDSAPIATDSSVSYERSMQIVIDKLEQAIADL